MTITEDQMLKNDYYELSDDELEVLFIIDTDPIMRTRLQKISLLYSKIFDTEKESHGAYFFGGYSDNIDEASDELVDKGIIQETNQGYVITDYGIKLKKMLIEGLEDSDDLITGIANIKKSVSELDDKSIIGLTYHFFEETTTNSTIKASVDRYNKRSIYDGKSLDQISLDEFINKLKKGTVIHRGG
ncbi:MAG: hypothetical protein IKN41_01075 [Candidatus Methanomethylophilaceae archaeon]|nr:hypothetical protein [Candidatus Methanomethylophilaceae archaeon]